MQPARPWTTPLAGHRHYVECIMSLAIWRGFSPAIVVALLFSSTPAHSHPEPHPIETNPEVVAWVQPAGVIDWDLRIQSFVGDDLVYAAQPDPLPICWQQNLRNELLDLEGNAALVWLRAREDGEVSAWVGPKLVAVPEPNAITMMLVGLAASCGFSAHRRAGNRRRPAAS